MIARSFANAISVCIMTRLCAQLRHQNRKLEPAKWGPMVKLHCEIPEPPMAQMGQKRRSQSERGSRACPLCSDSDRVGASQRSAALCQLRRNASQQTEPYSITSSARASSIGGTSRPSALAVLRLMTNSYLVTCWMGRSTGFSPLRIRPV